MLGQSITRVQSTSIVLVNRQVRLEYSLAYVSPPSGQTAARIEYKVSYACVCVYCRFWKSFDKLVNLNAAYVCMYVCMYFAIACSAPLRESERVGIDENYISRKALVWGVGGITQLSCGKEKPILRAFCVCVCVCGLCVQLAVVNLFSIKLYFIRFSMATTFAMFPLS